MKYFNIYFICCLISVVFLGSCKTDFDVDTQWKDITIVYGILNPNDTVHLIKVNKAFLGNESAYDMAKVSDSINYSNADVYLIEYQNGHEVKTITLAKTTEYIKDTGIFATDNNIVYKTNDVLNPTSEYKLNINIPNKPLITSSTKLISGLAIDFNGMVNFGSVTPVRVKWTSVANARLYELTIRFYYFEIKNADTTLKYLDWVQQSSISKHLDGDELMDLSISGESFYQYVASKISSEPNTKRFVKKGTFDFMFLMAGDELNTYIEVSRPSNTVVQEKPAFTNISNGIGIFSCKYNKSITDKQLSSFSIDSLAKGRFTKNLGFLDFGTTYIMWNSSNQTYNK